MYSTELAFINKKVHNHVQQSNSFHKICNILVEVLMSEKEQSHSEIFLKLNIAKNVPPREILRIFYINLLAFSLKSLV